MAEERERRAISEIPQDRLRRRIKVELFLRMYAYVGATISIVAIGYLIYSSLGINLNSQEQFALALSLTGAALSIFSFAMISFRKSRTYSIASVVADSSAEERFLNAWQMFEAASFETAWGNEIVDTRHSLRETFAQLVEQQIFTEEDRARAESLLSLRNSIVHRTNSMSADDVREGLEDVVTMLTKVS